MTEVTREEICVVACADDLVGVGEILVSPMGAVPKRAVALARATFAPDIVVGDGVANLVDEDVVEGWMPYRRVFETLWSGRRHVIMGASQIDQFGNTNISCIGDWAQPKVQLLGVRGGPGNTINHTTSYWIPNQSKRVFVAAVDMVSGLGTRRARDLGTGGRFHHIGRVVTNLGVYNFEAKSGRMRLASIHPGVDLDEVISATGFPLIFDEVVPTTRHPSAAELSLIRSMS